MYKIIISSVTRSRIKSEVLYFALVEGSLIAYSTTAELLQDKATLISFDWDNLFLWLSEQAAPMPTDIIDMEQVAKQVAGRKKVIVNNPHWSIWEILMPYYKEGETEFLIKAQRFYHGLIEVDESEMRELYFKMLLAMERCYEAQMEALNEKGEFDRFNEVERTIRMINLERTYKGIAINTENASAWINELSHKVYGLKNKLQLDYGIISSQDRGTIFRKLEQKGLMEEGKQVIDEKGFYFFLKDSKLRDPLLELLYEEKKQTTDLNVLLSIGALQPKYQHIYPVYDSFGTITSRTKMSSPGIQYLTKKYRSIVTAQKGKVLVYIDYAQFEAGILANDSADELLIKEYNDSDVYSELAKKIKIGNYITDDEMTRKFCKALFYKYSYGMDIKNHNGVLRDFKLEMHKATLSPLIIAAFESYPTLNKFREEIKQEAISSNKVGTHQGNFRYRLENENNVSWAMSQRIQGTASLILKRAIIALQKANPEIEFLIPMHDAALFQVNANEVEEKKCLIKKVFEEEFKKECPSINPIARFKNFSD